MMKKKKLKEPVLNEMTQEEQKQMKEDNETLKTQAIIQEELQALENPNLYRYRMLVLKQKEVKALQERNELLKEQNKLIKNDSGAEEEEQEDDEEEFEDDEEEEA